MNRSIYSLRIDCSESKKEGISKILNTTNNCEVNDIWIYEVVEGERYFDFINNFLDILENKYVELNQIGIQKENISIWFLYEYEEQCNIDFLPKDLKRIGDNNISLCISCWER